MSELPMCDRKEDLIAYLYGEAGPRERRAFEAHLGECSACAAELEAFGAVRTDLAAWTPPERSPDWHPASSPPPLWRRALPAWGLAAAAVLVIAAGAAVARLEVSVGGGGLVVRTGWSEAAATAEAPEEPWRAELAGLERRLRGELIARTAAPASASIDAPPPPQAPAAASGDDLMRQVRALVRESERRQERELALRLAQVVQDVERQRRSDLRLIEQGLGRLEGVTGAEVARQRALLNYLVRVSRSQ